MITVAKMRKACVGCACVALLGAATLPTASASFDQADLLDKVIAHVGDQAIFLSDLEGLYQQVLRVSRERPPDLKCMLLKSLVDEKLLLVEAKEKGIVVQEQEVTRHLDDVAQHWLAQAGSEEVLVRSLGVSVAQAKHDLRGEIEQKLMVEKVRAQLLQSISITPQEVKEFFTSLALQDKPYYPSEVTVRHIVKYLRRGSGDDKTTLEAAKDGLTKLRETILTGELTFAKAASQYSEDTTTASRGGLLTPGRRGGVRLSVRDFPTDLYFLIESFTPGMISDPMRFTTSDGKEAVRIVFLEEKTPPHPASLEQDYEKIRQMLLDQKSTALLEEHLARLRERTYIHMAPEYQHCTLF